MKLIRALFLLSCFVLASCEKTVINRGYISELADFSKIVVGKDNARFVFDNFGSPTMRSSVKNEKDEYSWYYVSKRIEKTGPLDPNVVDQKTIVITFNKDDIVKSVTENKYEQKIETVSETTKTEGKTKGIVGETFGGLGKYLKRYTDKGK